MALFADVDIFKTDRQRYGLNASAQAMLSDSLTLIGDVACTRLENRDRAVAIHLNSGYGPLALLPGSQVDGNGVVTNGIFSLPGFTVNNLSRGATSQAINTNLQLDFDNDGPFKASARWGQARARPAPDAFRGRQAGRIPWAAWTMSHSCMTAVVEWRRNGLFTMLARP